MPVYTESRHAAEFLISEGNGFISREEVTLGAGNLQAGTVLGQLTSGGNFVILAPAAADGSQNAVAILFSDCDASGGARKATVVRRHAEVRDSSLTWPGGITGPQKTTALASLASQGIIVR